jgi:hypothetical protein
LKKVLAAAALALALPATALAAKPVADGQYQQIKGNTFVVNFHVASTGKAIDEFSAYTKCNPVPFQPAIKMKITKAGTFALTGNRKDILGDKHKVVIRGKFVSTDKAKGFYKIAGKGCKAKKVKFVATLPPGPGQG